MTIFRCHECGYHGTKDTMIVSRHTGHAYCRDAELCELRVEKLRADSFGLVDPARETEEVA